MKDVKIMHGSIFEEDIVRKMEISQFSRIMNNSRNN